MLGLDLSEIVIIMVVALVVFGPEKLPEIARELGKWMAQMRRTADSVRREFYNEVYPPAQELRREFIEASRELRAVEHEVRSTLDKEAFKQPSTTPSSAAPPAAAGAGSSGAAEPAMPPSQSSAREPGGTEKLP